MSVGRAVLTICVAFSPGAGVVDEVVLELPEGATVMDAVQASGLAERHPDCVPGACPMGVWGVVCEPDHVLRQRDRVEVYRPLSVDPKEARRLRYRAGASGSPR